ncbi:MAG: hypothetical protein ACR2GY_08225 [Phycisphaerales bacterium]
MSTSHDRSKLYSLGLKPLLWLLLASLLTASPSLADEANPAKEAAEVAGEVVNTAKLEEIKSDALLRVPTDMSGDFTVAKVAPRVRFAVLPGQTQPARLWSSWGDALFASDGSLYVSIGDHDMPTGKSLVFRVNSETGQITTVMDINAITGVAKGMYAPGKVHAPIYEDRDGKIWAIGYRGSTRGHNDKVGYMGDPLLWYDPATNKAEFYAHAVPFSSVAAMTYHAPSHSFYGLNSPGDNAPEKVSRFFVYDIAANKLKFFGGPAPTKARSLFTHPDGRAWYDTGGKLAMYDPNANEVVQTEIELPAAGGTLRAASGFTSKGTAWGISQRGTIISFTPDATTGGKIEAFTDAFVAGPLYTAACKLSPDGRYLYYAPSAHGRSSQSGTPVLQFDTHTGKRKVIAFLHDALLQARDYHLGGTYALEVSPDGSTIGIGWNGGQKGQKKPDFGLCSVMLLEIPASERGGE